jgi:hypothetical protein
MQSRGSSHAAEEDEGRHGMVLNSCVGSQVRAPLPALALIDSTIVTTQVLNLLLGVGLPSFISAAIGGQGGAIQVAQTFTAALRFILHLTCKYSA